MTMDPMKAHMAEARRAMTIEPMLVSVAVDVRDMMQLLLELEGLRLSVSRSARVRHRAAQMRGTR